MSRIPAIVVLTALLVAASSCGGGSGSSLTPPSTVFVQIAPTTATVLQGGTQTFTATVTGTSNTAVSWSVQEGSNGGTIDNTGLYAAPRSASGIFHILATSQADSTARANAEVVVPKRSVRVSPVAVTLAPGETQSFEATVGGLVNTNVTWTVQEAGGGSVSNAGFYNAPQVTGVYHVIATSVADATLSGSATITVTTSTGIFTPTGSMEHGRGFHTATLLSNGNVLLAGGSTTSIDPICLGGIASAEVYNPTSGSFTTRGTMTSLRYAHAATSLLNGRVLVTGGFASPPDLDCFDGEPALQGADLYDPSRGSFHATGNMVVGRGGHTATLLLSGKVLVAGGGNQGGGSLPFYGAGFTTAELYDPGAGVFNSTGSMAKARLGHTATLLPNGKVLIVGGVPTSVSQPTVTAEIYDPVTGAFALTGSMALARAGHTATLLQNGKVLITGGYHGLHQW